jgi:MoaA/NifB/PqqE/SkfB family radical SAM enzyme
MKTKLMQIIYLAKYAINSRTKKGCRNPLLCSFKITGNCNLKCMHCPFWRDGAKNSPGSPGSPGSPNSLNPQNIPGSPNSLSFENIKVILQNLYSEGVRIVIFEGGEPLLWKDEKDAKDLNDVIEYAKRLFFFTGVTTNGTIDIERLNPDVFFISIDGTQETHDELRGKSFALIMKNIERNRSQKKIIANICISSENANEIEELVKFLNNKVYGITIQFFYPYESVGNLKLGNKEKKEVLKNLIKLKRKGLKLLNSISCMKMMANNNWKCDDFLVVSVEQDGMISRGCYLKNKAVKVSCEDCGFSVHCEISLAYRFNPDAIRTAARIFWS